MKVMKFVEDFFERRASFHAPFPPITHEQRIAKCFSELAIGTAQSNEATAIAALLPEQCYRLCPPHYF